MGCGDPCQLAKRDGRCKCSCGGRNHGRLNDRDQPLPYHTVNEHLGGEAGKIIKHCSGEKIGCWCGRKFYLSHWMGYEHSGGVEDKDGVKWWIFVICPYCNYEWSIGKLEQRLCYAVRCLDV